MKHKMMLRDAAVMLGIIIILTITIGCLRAGAEDEKPDVTFTEVKSAEYGDTVLRMYKSGHIRMSVSIKNKEYIRGKLRTIRSIIFFTAEKGNFSDDDLLKVWKYVGKKIVPGSVINTDKGSTWKTTDGFLVVHNKGEGLSITKEDLK